MAAGKLNIKIDQGSDFVRLLTLKDANGNPLNLTGFSFSGRIRRTIADPDVLATFSFSIADQSNPSNLGKVTMSIGHASTATLPAIAEQDASKGYKTFVYDVKMTNASGSVERILTGSIEISPEVTR